MRTSKLAETVKGVFSGGGVSPSESSNTHVTLASQSDQNAQIFAPDSNEPTPNHGEKDGDGRLPESITFKGDRARVLKEIAERRNAQAVAEGNEDLPKTDEDGREVETNAALPEPDGVDLDASPQEQTPDHAHSEPVAAEPAPAAAAPEETRTLIVDGRQVQVPVSKILDTGTRALQKEIAADLRLNQATQILEEAKRVALQPQAPQPAPAVTDGLNEEQLAEMIQFGTKEQAAAAIKALRAPAAPVINPEEIVRAAQAAVAPQIAFEQGKNFATKEYGDLLNDPDLGAIFLNRENAMRKAGDQRGYEELYKAIGEDMRVKFNRPKPGAAQAQAAQPSTNGRTMAEKQAAKAQAPAAPRLASQRLDGDGQQPRPPTRGEVIDKMRRARAFQPYAAQK